ncbi:MAG: NADH-quinone oxidoreductase subunit M, partial [Actinobacteria bacterium]|nr:NADH-quinone oxidoreductase subunit M [Actinomycetota bacterium]
MSLLTAIGLLPLISAGMIALIPTRNNELIKRATLVATTIIAISSIFLAVSFDKNSDQLQFVQKKSWISAFNINFSLGIDGISLVLILLSTILVPIVILATWNESENGRWSSKVFYVLLLTLESLMIGVFAANDLFLFYVFFEAMLIPVYFLIGGYGTGNKSAAAIKFLLYSLFGGLLMLASIIGVYIISSNQIGATFDITQLATLEIDNQTENFLFLGFFIAFAIKAPLWPF